MAKNLYASAGDKPVSQLASAIAQHCETTLETPTAIEGLTLYRSEKPKHRMPAVMSPTICVVAQGHKSIYFGNNVHSYNPDNYLINSVTMPVEVEITNASPSAPYLGLSLEIDSYIVGQLLVDMGKHSSSVNRPAEGVILATSISKHLKSCFIRLIDCLNNPMDQAVLAPSLKREIYYEVLKSPFGDLLKNCLAHHSGSNRIAPVVHYIEENFEKPLDIEGIARCAGMSTSSLHEHFKQVTSLTPMQFIKSLRLHRAHSLLLSGTPVSDASYQSGYNSPSQFSREFKRFFGTSPRDIHISAA